MRFVKLPSEEYDKILESRGFKRIGNYVDTKTHCLIKCLKDGYEWSPTPSRIQQGGGCPRCSGRERVTTEEYDELLESRGFKRIGPYVDTHTPCLIKCLKDGREWSPTAHNVKRGTGCPLCGGTEKLTQENYEEILKTKGFVLIGPYVNVKTKCPIKCLKDGYEWSPTPDNVKRGRGCPRCSRSKLELRVERWLEFHDIEYISEHAFPNCKDKRPLPFDFYIPSANTLIECHGEQHYQMKEFFGGKDGFDIIQKHDSIKSYYARKNNIRFTVIPYDTTDIEFELLLLPILTLKKVI